MEIRMGGLLLLCSLGLAHSWPIWSMHAVQASQAASEEELHAPKTTTPMPVVTHQLSFTLQGKTAENGGKKHKGADMWVTLHGSKASSAKLYLTPGRIDFEPGETYTFLVAAGKDLGEVQSLVLFWDANTWFWTSTQYLWQQGNVNLRNMNTTAAYRTPRPTMEEKKDFHTTLIR
ncbi:hypothetical protein RvY_12502 [Ramazzottius varieornatus]|uniref:PLAT domain-containing protein n=1 Tax=Ramazzottius varieornatus TaxID=947166 RepID=A0A1D1VJS7_RAMVA|nr:hypothetical protein RvY_12502 [Ramazzottius varieornatus]